MSAGLTRVRLGPARLHGCDVVIRPPRCTDHADWQRLRVRDRALIEPFWYSSESSWDERHTEKQWLREYLVATAEVARGRRLSGVIEIDGRFAGQCELCSIDTRSGTAELSIWIDSRLARHGFGGLAAALVLDYGFHALGLERVVAPISPANAAAAHAAAELGFVREALMVRYFDAGGARRDHALWAVTRGDIPEGGFAEAWIRHVLAKRASAGPEVPGERGGHPARLGLPMTIVTVGVRLLGGAIRRRFALLRGGCPVRIPVPGRSDTVLRSRRLSDGPAWREARLHNRHRLDGGSPGDWERQHSRTAWWREFAGSRGGLRSPGGLVLVLEVGGAYAGEARLFDLDMFDRNARMFVWADPARADIGVRTAATRALLDYAFHMLGLYRVATEIDAADTESAAVAASAGLLEEGIMRNHAGPCGRRADHILWASTVAEPHQGVRDA
ncbi:GNAT family N-acetyltransferase [Nocardia transvalensis]|uniref:GNAT family N-acetyltransferase n=1 Tax=Nocardia transvalensis TaxID=37333 RepID=UPI001895DE65|nr:GNAT family protein [Nocardia transvalensis]MBF6327868.1 GNAT family N-acetyltransferase [Nocardia transvalensis]